jgi:hypothetical protein
MKKTAKVSKRFSRSALLRAILALLITFQFSFGHILAQPCNNPIYPSVTSIGTSCYGQNTGEAIVTYTGGNQPITPLWSNGSTSINDLNLSAGTYYVTLTDALGCIYVDSAVVSGAVLIMAV